MKWVVNRSLLDFCIALKTVETHVKKDAFFSGDKGTNRVTVNPLSPHDALKHHFTSLKTGLIFLQLCALE